MSRYRLGGPRCEAIVPLVAGYGGHRCRNSPVPGMRHCHYHGERPPRLVVKEGPRRGFVEISCIHMSVRVTFEKGEAQRWATEVLGYTKTHTCFRLLRKNNGMLTMGERRKAIAT